MSDVDTVSEHTAEGAGEGDKGLHLGVSGLSLDKSNEEMEVGKKDKEKRREEMLRRIAESVERPARDGPREGVERSGSHVEGPSYAVEPSSSATVGQEEEGMKHTVTTEELHLSNQVKPVQTCSASKIVNERLVMPNNGNTDGSGKDEPNQINPVQTGSEESKDTNNSKADIALGESGRKDNVGDLTAQPDDHGVTVKKEESDEIQQEKTVSSTDTRTSNEKKKTRKKKKKVPVAENPMLVILQHIQQCLMEWRTETTLRYLYSRSSSPSDEPVPDTPDTDPALERKKMALKEFEKRVGARLDREEIKEGAFPAPSKPLPDFESLRREEAEKYALKVKEYFMGREMKAPSKPATEEKEEPNKVCCSSFNFPSSHEK